MKSFENSVLSGADRDRFHSEKISPTIEKAYRRTTDMFIREAIDMNVFIQNSQGEGVYTEQDVEANKVAVKDLKKKFKLQETPEERNRHMKSLVAEGLIYRGIDKYDWFGGARAIKTSDYDDYVNGIDIMAEFGTNGQSPQGVMGLMIDVTFSRGALEKKMERTREELQRGKLASIKYFQSKNDPRFMGRFSGVPRVVVGMSHMVVEQLAKHWMSEYEEDEKMLFDTPVQRMILEQALIQLRAQSQYAESLGHEEIAEILKKEARFMRSILDKKVMPLGMLADDGVHSQIIDAVRVFTTGANTSANSSLARSASSGVTNTTYQAQDRPHKPKLSLKK